MHFEKAAEYDLEDKNEICAQIFESGFFEWFEYKVVQFDIKEAELMKELRENYRDIYDDMYLTWPNLESGEWMNPIKERKLYINGEEFKEKVFRCLVRDKKSEPVSYISYFYRYIYY